MAASAASAAASRARAAAQGRAGIQRPRVGRVCRRRVLRGRDRRSATRGEWLTALRWKEPAVGALILAPALLDAGSLLPAKRTVGGMGIARRQGRQRRADRADNRRSRMPVRPAARVRARRSSSPRRRRWPLTRAMPCRIAHPAAQPPHDRFDLDDVAGMDRAAVADALDAGEEGQPLPVLGLGQNHDGADLGDRFGQDRRRQRPALRRRAGRGSAR